MIRAVHLEPVFARGHTSDFLPSSIAQCPDEQDKNWEYFYINMYAFSLAIFCCSDLISIARCVDRDMLMCFCGLGVGHKNTWHETQVL